MARNKRKKQKKLPPHLDPEKYTWVQTKEGGHPRRKRGTVKEAVLNDTLKENTSKTAIVSSYNKRIREALEPYTRNLVAGRLGNRMNKMMFEELKKNGKLNPAGLTWLEFNEDYPLDKLLTSNWGWKQDEDQKAFVFKIQIPKHGAIPKLNRLADSYVFTVILAHYDGKKKSVYHTLTCSSMEYRLDKKQAPGECLLKLPLPPKKSHWLLVMKAESYEEGAPGKHPMHKGMRVLAGGIA